MIVNACLNLRRRHTEELLRASPRTEPRRHGAPKASPRRTRRRSERSEACLRREIRTDVAPKASPRRKLHTYEPLKISHLHIHSLQEQRGGLRVSALGSAALLPLAGAA